MSTNDNKTFGERLRLLRSERNLSQAEFGEVMGEIMGTKRISSSAVGAYERNEREPTYALLRAIAEYFNVSIDYLLCNSDEKLTVERFNARNAFELGELLKMYRVELNGVELCEEQNKRLLDIAAVLILSDRRT